MSSQRLEYKLFILVTFPITPDYEKYHSYSRNVQKHNPYSLFIPENFQRFSLPNHLFDYLEVCCMGEKSYQFNKIIRVVGILKGILDSSIFTGQATIVLKLILQIKQKESAFTVARCNEDPAAFLKWQSPYCAQDSQDRKCKQLRKAMCHAAAMIKILRQFCN